MSHSAKAANRIKQEAGFRSCLPAETLILAVFNYEELYNSKSKHDSNWLLLSRKCNWKRSSSRHNSPNRCWYLPYLFPFFIFNIVILRAILPGAFLPRRLWSGCAFKSCVWCDRALRLRSQQKRCEILRASRSHARSMTDTNGSDWFTFLMHGGVEWCELCCAKNVPGCCDLYTYIYIYIYIYIYRLFILWIQTQGR